MTLVVRRIVNDNLYVSKIYHKSYFLRLAQYLVRLEAYMSRINHASYFSLQVQYLMRLEGESSCSAHCK